MGNKTKQVGKTEVYPFWHMEDTIWRRNLSFFTDDSGSRIKPLELIKSNHYPICTILIFLPEMACILSEIMYYID